MLLYINTADFKNLQLATISKEKTTIFDEIVAFNENFKTLEKVEKFLKKNKYLLKDVTKVVVNSGPGSFTGIRVGVSLAQAIGMGLNIPTVAIPSNRVPTDLSKLLTIKVPPKLTLHYGAKPNITKSKKKTR